MFTDLYRVRQGVRAVVENYSIKQLEPLCGYGRRAELAKRLGEALPRPVFAEKPPAAEDPETARIRSALLAGVPAETPGAIAWGVSAETPEGQARVLLADLLDWHRREDKPAWWRYFYVRTLSPAELTDEPDALGRLTGGDVVGQVHGHLAARFQRRPENFSFHDEQVQFPLPNIGRPAPPGHRARHDGPEGGRADTRSEPADGVAQLPSGNWCLHGSARRTG